MAILLATDFSQPAERAYAYAAGLGKPLGKKVVILNVLEGPPGLDREFPANTFFLKRLQEESDQGMANMAGIAAKDGLVWEPRQVYGNPAACITQVASEIKAGLIVMGTHGHTGWSRLLLGSNAEAVVREAPCPVLTVRIPVVESVGFPPPVRIEHLLVPVDFSDCAQEALEYAAMLAKQLGAQVRLVHAMEAAAYPLDFALFGVREEAALRVQIHRRLEELESVLKADGVAAEVHCEVGTPRDVILRQAKQCFNGSNGLILMGTHGRRGLNRLVLGSVAEHVVRYAACPVLTVKSPRYRHDHSAEVRGAKQII